MNRGLFILLLTFGFIDLISTEALSQEVEYTPLIKEILEKSKFPGVQEWVNDKKTSYQYNAKGKEIYQQVSLWEDEKSNWKIIHEEFSNYNNEDNRNWIHFINYNDYPDVLNEREEFREFKDGRVTYRKIFLNDYSDPHSVDNRVYDVFYTYNENGNLIEYRVKYVLGEVFQGGYGYRWYYNNTLNCRVAVANYNLNGLFNEEPSDSTHIIRDSNCNIRQRSVYAFIYNSYQLIFQQQFDYEYDSKGRILRQVEFQRHKSYESFEKDVEITYTYNESDLITSSFRHDHTDNSETYRTIVYDTKDRIIRETVQNRLNPESPWITGYDFIRSFNSFDKVEKSETYSDWNQDTGEFRNYTITENFFDPEGNIIQTVTDLKFAQTTSHSEHSREFRCDGEIISENINYEEYNDGLLFQSEEIIQTTYFTQAPCREVDAVQPYFALYPNPADHYFHIYSEEPFGYALLRVMKASGEVVKEVNAVINNYFSIDVNALEPGLYLVQVESEFGNYSRKFVKK